VTHKLQFIEHGKIYHLTGCTTLHSDRFASWQTAERSPPFHFQLSLGPRVFVQTMATNIRFYPPYLK